MVELFTHLAQAGAGMDYQQATLQTDSVESFTALLVLMGITLIPFTLIYIFSAICLYSIFKKANRAGWAAIVPFYNSWVYMRLGGKAGWWVFVPIANVIMSILASIEITRRFGKEDGYAVLLILLPIIGLPMLAFGDAVYTYPGQATDRNGPPPTTPSPLANPSVPQTAPRPAAAQPQPMAAATRTPRRPTGLIQ